MTRRSVLLLTFAAAVMLFGCTSNAPKTERPVANSAAPEERIATTPTAVQQTVKSQHDCVSGKLSQHYVVETARLEGEPSAHLDYCFVSGYRGIGCPER
jgi:ABC-type phosphate/phosphonate transport system substrate-binding protein